MASHDAVAVPETSARDVVAERPKRQKKPLPIPVHYPFWFGGSASSMAACVTHPLDLGTETHSPRMRAMRVAESRLCVPSADD